MKHSSAEATKERILDIAYDLVLDQGYAATSLDQILEKAGITKGAFFYHFSNKADLAQTLMERFAAMDHLLFLTVSGNAERKTQDPLAQVICMVEQIEEKFKDLDGGYPGCLMASYCYQSGLQTDAVMAVIRGSMLEWSGYIKEKLQKAASLWEPAANTDFGAVATLFHSVLEGAYVMARTFENAKTIAGQLAQYRVFLDLLFGGRTRRAKPE